ncbi:hypothetical protein [uncultured Bacteroides sp.]|uniref:hypothetical protein n=1 Tax=uncultured Bacteroides sp. TaxID=162156 RepID=UPI002AAB9CE1|nr:hypothetical protein [uncultured Bacteroides sp.]
MKELIIAYLRTHRNFYEGVALYDQFGVNRMLKAQFRKIGETEAIKKTLFEELRKLAGLTETEFKSLKRVAFVAAPRVSTVVPKVYDDDQLLALADKFGITVDELVSDETAEKILSHEDYQDQIEELTEELSNAKTKYCQVPEAVKKTIRFREDFPFLNAPDCPDKLKVLVADMFRAYDVFREAHEQLVNMPDNTSFGEAFKEAQTAVESYLDNREMWEELEYYKENGEILGKAGCLKSLVEQKEISGLSDLDLSKQISNARSNISKAKASLQTAENDEDKAKAETNLSKWETRKALLDTELEKRK